MLNDDREDNFEDIPTGNEGDIAEPEDEPNDEDEDSYEDASEGDDDEENL